MVINKKNLDDKKLVNLFMEKCIQKTLSSVHIMASSSIGENKFLCPLNSSGKINGIENLLIIDQSTFPSCPTVNPQATATLFSLINTTNYMKKL